MTLTETAAGDRSTAPAPRSPAAADRAREAPDPTARAPIAERVGRRVGGLLAVERRRWATVHPHLVEPFDALEAAALAGGKRLRPVFCHWGWRCAGGDLDDAGAVAAATDVGAALELLHAFALVHDDVMDDADTRRGHTTTHVAAARRHEASGWRGEARRFGDSVAILVGDLAHVLADALVAEQGPAPRALWRELQVELVLGQHLDVVGTAHGQADDRHARLVARLKSGRYTIEQPLRLGASLVGDGTAGRDLDTHLVAYGAPLGMAFQLRDDVLGAVGAPEATGKPVGDDLREGKPTPLLALARRRATTSQRALLDRVGAADLCDDEVAALQEVLATTGALAEVEEEIDELVGAALTALGRAPVPAPAAEALAVLADQVARRDR